jgi:hypothetical protein
MLQASPLKSRDSVSDPVRISSARHAADAFHVGIGLLAALLRSSLAATASSMAGTADTEIMRAPISDTRYNPCVDEFATTTGIVHVVQHTTTTQNGVTRTFSYVHQGMTGTGLLSGARYVETHVENQSSYFSTSPPPLEVTDTETLVLNRVTPNGTITDDDYLLHVTARMTISASGQVTDKSLDFKPECR